MRDLRAQLTHLEVERGGCPQGRLVRWLAIVLLVAAVLGLAAFASWKKLRPQLRGQPEEGDAPAAAYLPQKPWQYWEVCNGERCPPPQQYGDGQLAEPAEEQFLILETGKEGWNNERMCIEVAYALAFLWRRTLVLPPYFGSPFGHDPPAAANEVLDMEAMSSGVKVMFAADFVAYAKKHPQRFPGGQAAVSKLDVIAIQNFSRLKYEEWSSFPGWLRGLEGVASEPSLGLNAWENGCRDVCVAERSPAAGFVEDYKAFATPSRAAEPTQLTDAEWAAAALKFRKGDSLGHYYSKIYVEGAEKRRELRRAVRRGVRLQEVFFQAAAAALAAAGLEPGSYAALHNRQGDWETMEKSAPYLDPMRPGLFTDQLENREFLEAHGVIYVATKATKRQAADMDRVWYPALREKMAAPKRIVTFAGLVREAARRVVGDRVGWEPLVEMIICSHGSTFLGTYGSSFTGYIHRLRGHMPGTRDKRILFWDWARAREKHLTSDGFPSWSAAVDAMDIGYWVEWREGFSDRETEGAEGASG